MSVYIHYGSSSFNPHLFQPITNRAFQPNNKPSGGLWASPVDARFGWRDWCEIEEFGLDRFNTCFRFRLTPAAKVCHLYTCKDLDLLPPRSDSDRFGFRGPDFEQMMKNGWDAIELHLSNDNGLYWKLYGWDCDSILVMNPKVIAPVPHI